MIDQMDSEVIQWANSLVNAKKAAEQASSANNHALMLQWKAYADQARDKLRSLGFSWVANALSADGTNAAQAASYVQSLSRHLTNWTGPAIQTPALSLSDALAGRVYQVSGSQVTVTSWGGEIGGIASNILGGLGQGIGSGITSASAPARDEASKWVDVGAKATRALIIPLAIYAGVKILPGLFRALKR